MEDAEGAEKEALPRGLDFGRNFKEIWGRKKNAEFVCTKTGCERKERYDNATDKSHRICNQCLRKAEAKVIVIIYLLKMKALISKNIKW